MGIKKYIRRRIVKQKSIKEQFPMDLSAAFDECILSDEKRYKYVRFGITTDLKQEYDKRKRIDEISWSSMKVYYQIDDPRTARNFIQQISGKENYIENQITFPETFFDERPSYFAYAMVGRRKKNKNSLMKTVFKIGTLFSGIGAFEHALKQLNIEHEIKFACDCGERELPLTFGNFAELIKDLTDDEISNYCIDYINRVGVKVEYRETEINELIKYAHDLQSHNEDDPIVIKFFKAGRKSAVQHKLILTQDQIIQLTPGMSMKQRETYVNKLYANMGEHNYVKDAYFANYEIKEDQWHEDIRFLDANEFNGDIDIMIGGSPCQSFSNYGKKLGLEDVRGTLFYDYARIIKESQPKVFIYENVQNLLNHDGKKTWKIMLEVWKSLGYELNFKILDAKDFNHPQLRTRLFLIGFRKDIYDKPYVFPEKQELTHKSTEYLEEGPIDMKYYLGKKGFEWITTPSKNLRRSRVNQDIIGCETANQQDNWIGDFRVEHPEQRHYDDERVYIGKFDFGDGKGMVDAVGRKMTPRECMNLMGFDDTFEIAVGDSIAYRHAGNSIVVPVLKELIKSLQSYL